VLKVFKDLLVPQVIRVLQEPLEIRGPQELKVYRDQLELLAHKVYRV
jgi:hypothetical protein